MPERTLNAIEKQLNILIVDDDASMCDTLLDIFEDKGFGVTTAQDGQTAVAQMRSGQYDLVIIDIMMPGMNGVETLREVKAINPNVTTLVMTGQSQSEALISEALWAGVDGVLYKPFDVEAVLKVLDRKSRDRAELPVIDLKRYQVDIEAIKLVPEKLARGYTLLPLKVEQGYLIVAMVNPNDPQALEDLRSQTSLHIKPLRASQSDIENALMMYYQNAVEIERQIDLIVPTVVVAQEETAQRLSAEQVAQAPVVRAVELMVMQAVKDKASDIHIEPQESHLRIRYRIDGVLHDAMRLPLHVHAPVISRIKVLSNLNIAERRRPQDGQFSLVVEGRPIDFRVATVNTIHGEMAVVRVLDKAMSVRGLGDIGFLPDMKADMEKLLHSPWGIILIAGPTGSGKTSTLYSAINQLDRDESKIITIEDPVEYRFAGICQMQVNRQAGITFAGGLRAAMRLDPNVILVGEIRDQETASIAVQASLTGHLVLSSIHANDSVGAIFRLIDLGVEPFLVTSGLLAVISQRLVRRVCAHCRAPRDVPAPERLAYEQELGETRGQFDYGGGCNYCAQTGYRGRIAAFELLQVNEVIRQLVLKGANANELRATALRAGMITMRHDGMLKVKAGITTPHEVLRKVFTMT